MNNSDQESTPNKSKARVTVHRALLEELGFDLTNSIQESGVDQELFVHPIHGTIVQVVYSDADESAFVFNMLSADGASKGEGSVSVDPAGHSHALGFDEFESYVKTIMVG